MKEIEIMPRYIDANDLISVLDILCDKGGDIRYWEQLKWIVADCPTADVVEVVRCKDCKYFLNSNEKCSLIDTRLQFYATDKSWASDCFCAWGERRDDAEIH